MSSNNGNNDDVGMLNWVGKLVSPAPAAADVSESNIAATATSAAVGKAAPESGHRKPGGGGGSGGTTISTAGSGSSSSSSLSSLSKTYGWQGQLPHLPIPTLEETLGKLPSVLEALQETDGQKRDAEAAVDEFLRGDGPALQKALIEYERRGVRDGSIGSYVEEFWNESYLSPDESVVLNLNPYFVLEKGPDPKIANDQLRRAASLCFASVKLASLLRHETLSPDIFKGRPLCMDQFKVLFGSCRQPRSQRYRQHDEEAVDGQDSKENGDSDDIHVYNDSAHVAVLCRNQFYYFTALWPDTGHVAVDEGDILDALRAIRNHADREADAVECSRDAVGVLTSLPRSKWARARRDLCTSSEANRKALRLVDSALFVLVLDDYSPPSIHHAASNMLHGTSALASASAVSPRCDFDDGGHPCPDDRHPHRHQEQECQGEGETIQVGTCLNRWYDKLQLIVCSDGTAGVNFEHAAIDGHTALRYVSDVFAETVVAFAQSITRLVHGDNSIPSVIEATVIRAAGRGAGANDAGDPVDASPKKVVFELSDSDREKIFYAETALCDEIIANESVVMEFRDYGKLLIVGNRISPDAFVQLSIMLAYYVLYGKIVCTYEPVLTKSFYHGRTEAMRSATKEAKEFCQVWCRPESSPEEKLAALRTAASAHSKLVKQCAAGKGVDRHLFALKCMSERMGLPLPKFYQSEAWKTLNHTVLSTSNCGNPSLRLFGFGPVVQNGFGIGYIIKDHGLSYSVASKHRQTHRYVRTLERVLREMKDLFQPLSSVRVHQRGATTVAAPAPAATDAVARGRQPPSPAPPTSTEEEASAYDDIYGESSAPAPAPAVPPPGSPTLREDAGRRSMVRRDSKNFTYVKERRAGIELLDAWETVVVKKNG